MREDKEYLFHIYWGAVIILLPPFIRALKEGIDPAFSKNQFFVACVAASIAFFGFFRSYSKNNMRQIFIAGSLILLASLNRKVFASISYNHQLICFCAGLLLFLQMTVNLKSKYIYVIKTSLAVAAFIQSFFVIFSYSGIDPYPILVGEILGFTHKMQGFVLIKATGTLGNPNYTGAFIAMTLPFVFERYKKMSIFVFIALVLTSGMPVISFMYGAYVYVWLKVFKGKKLKELAGISIIGAILCFVGNYFEIPFFDDKKRFSTWYNSLTLLDAKSWFIGNGLGYFYDVYPNAFPAKHVFKQLHNEYMEVLHAFGLTGILALIAFFANKVRHILKGDLFFVWSLVVLGANSFGHFTFHISSTALLGIIVIAYLMREESYEYAKK